MEAPPHTLVLACDHRGNGLASAFSAITRSDWRVTTSGSVVASADRLGAGVPHVLVLDPLVEGGRAELETILAKTAPDARPAVLLLFDPLRPEA
jgi:hypothetical protein